MNKALKRYAVILTYNYMLSTVTFMLALLCWVFADLVANMAHVW